MCKEAVRRKPYALGHVPDHLKTHEMCEKANEEDPWRLYAVPDRLKTKRIVKKLLKINQKTLDIYQITLKRSRFVIRL